MIILYTGILLILISLIRNDKISPYVGFAFVFLIMGFQEGVKGDYMGYKEAFERMDISRTSSDEPLWDIITFFFHPLGWRVFVITLTAFQCWVLAKITIRYTSKQYHWLSPILFFFWFGMMLIQMKAMRQGLAIELCLLPMAIDLTNKKRKWPWCFSPWVAAYFIHNSCLIILPIVALYYMQVTRNLLGGKNHSKRGEFYYPVIVTASFYALYVVKTTFLNDYFSQIALLFTDFRLSDYMSMRETEGDIFNVSSLLIFADTVFVFLNTWCYKKVTGTCRILLLMAIISSFLDMLFFGMGSLPRMGYYYLPGMIISLPIVTKKLKLRFGRIFAYAFIVMCIGYTIKTSLPWIQSVIDGGFGTYRFFFT